ncbi:hypothetical protein GCM10027443_37670 [Pontibacter brevis]
MYSVRPWLYIGKCRDTVNLPRLKSNHIRGMLQLEDLVEQLGIHVLHLQVADGHPIPEKEFQRGIHFVLLEHKLGRNVLIACGAGISRSVTYAIAALKETEGLSLLAAYGEIVKRNYTALPHAVIWKSLCAYYNEDVPYIEVLRQYNIARS